MAKRQGEQSGQRPNSQLRVLFVELNGADTTIEEALRTVERMRRSPEILRQPINRITTPTSAADGQTTPEESTSCDASPIVEDYVNGGEGETENAPLRQKRGQGPKKDRNAGIELVGNLDFVPKGKPALKSFFTEKAPGSDMDQVLVICHYLQHTLELPAYGPGHILTGFKHVGERVPVDLKATIRNMKKEKAWLSITEMENIRVTTEGDNRVEHELGKVGPSEGA